jgi:hypothetical protein
MPMNATATTHTHPRARDGVNACLLQHDHAPLQVVERRRRARKAGVHGRGHTKTQQQAAIIARLECRLFKYVRIAGSFAIQGVFAHRPMHQRVEKEQTLCDRRHPSKPQIAAADVCQFVCECHGGLVVVQRVRARK